MKRGRNLRLWAHLGERFSWTRSTTKAKAELTRLDRKLVKEFTPFEEPFGPEDVGVGVVLSRVKVSTPAQGFKPS